MISLFEQAPCRQSNLGLLDLELLLDIVDMLRIERGAKKVTWRDSRPGMGRQVEMIIAGILFSSNLTTDVSSKGVCGWWKCWSYSHVIEILFVIFLFVLIVVVCSSSFPPYDNKDRTNRNCTWPHSLKHLRNFNFIGCPF